jgi:hypothetical protein
MSTKSTALFPLVVSEGGLEPSSPDSANVVLSLVTVICYIGANAPAVGGRNAKEHNHECRARRVRTAPSG